MPDNAQIESAPSMAALVGGIINDAQQLLRQEVALARREVHEGFEKAKTAAVSFGIGLAVASLGGLMLCFMLVHLLHWLTIPGGSPPLPGSDPASIPLWGCYGIVGGVFFVIGVILISVAKRKVSEIEAPQTAETMKENVQWLKNKTS